MLVVSSVAKALGHPLEGIGLPRSTIRRVWIATRKDVSQADKDSFSTQGLFHLHWDGKLLPDIA